MVNNRGIYAMATIASLLDVPHNSTHCEILVEQLLIPTYNVCDLEPMCQIVELGSSWYCDIYTYLCNNTLSPNISNHKHRTFILQASQYIIIDKTLYKISLDGTLRICLQLEVI